MEKFIKKATLYLIVIILAGCAIIYLSITIAPGKMLGNATEYALWQYKIEAIKKVYSSPKNIIIGDSRVLTGLNPLVIQHNIINLSVSGTTSFEGNTTIKEFLKHNKIDTMIVSYGIFHYIESDVLEKWTLLYQFNNIHEVNALENLERSKQITLDNRMPEWEVYLNRKATYYHNPFALRPTFIENLKQSDFNPGVIKQLRETLGFSNISKVDSANGINTEVEIARQTHQFKPNAVILAYLDSINNIAGKNNIKAVLLIPPMNTTSYLKLKSTVFWAQFNAFIKALRKRYPKMEINHTNVYLPNNYFADNNHLNHRGADSLSRYVRDSVMRKL